MGALILLALWPSQAGALCLSNACITLPVPQPVSSNPLAAQYIPALTYSGPSWVWAADASTKVFRDTGGPGTIQVSTPSGVRMETIPFQFFIQAPIGGLTNVNVWMSNLTNTQTGAVVSSDSLTTAGWARIYVSSYVFVSTLSVTGSGGGGYYGNSAYGHYLPDPIIPIPAEPYYHQKTNVMPMTIQAGQNQGFWGNITMPTGTASGYYAYTIYIATGSPNTIIAQIPGAFELFDATMSATATRLSYNTPGYADLCVQQYGGPTSTGCKAYNSHATDDNDGARIVNHDECVFLLDHRWSCGGVNTAGDSVTTMDTKMGHLFDGTNSATLINTLLPGAKLASAQEGLQPTNLTTCNSWMSDFSSNGRNVNAMMPFDYAADEPSGSTQFKNLISSMTSLASCKIPYLVTTDYSTALTQGATALINIMLPTVNSLSSSLSAGMVSGWQVSQSSAVIGTYSDCLSGANGNGHGPCNNNPPTSFDPGLGTGYANPHIDGLPVSNMATEWTMIRDTVTLELNSTPTYCWTHACGSQSSPANPWISDGMDYKGQGDETWLYPGTTAAIGVTTPTFVGSIRLDLSMVGAQDWERANMLKVNGSTGTVFTALNSWMTNESTFNENPYSNGSYSGTITSARQTMGCALHDLAHPGASCGW